MNHGNLVKIDVPNIFRYLKLRIYTSLESDSFWMQRAAGTLAIDTPYLYPAWVHPSSCKGYILLIWFTQTQNMCKQKLFIIRRDLLFIKSFINPK